MAPKTIRTSKGSSSSSSSLTSATSSPLMVPLKAFDANIPLLTTNALVELSSVPGYLDYAAYVQYLIRHGHLRNPPEDQNFPIPAQPANSSLLQHDRGDRTDGLTDYRPDQALWSQDNLPEIIYIFDRPANWLGRVALKEPPAKSYPIYGKFLRDIPILPDHISPDLAGWRYEAFSRFDPRIKKDDIINRFPPAARGGYNNDLSMRTIRFRREANVLGWVAKGGKFEEDRLRIQGLLQAAGIPLTANTTRGITWGSRPNAPPIPVPAKLRWASCVEAAPTQTPVAPVMLTIKGAVAPPLLAVVLSPLHAPIAAVTGADADSLACFTVPADMIPSLQGKNIPVTLAASPRISPITTRRVVPSPSSSSSSPRGHAPLLNQSPLPPNPPPCSVSGDAIPKQLLDPLLFQRWMPGGVPAPGNTIPLPQLSHAGPWMSDSNGMTAPDPTTSSFEQVAGIVRDARQYIYGLHAPLSVPNFGESARGCWAKNPERTGLQDPDDCKRGGDNDENSSCASPSTRQAFEKLRRVPAAATSYQSRRRFRTRFPRSAFGGMVEDMQQSLDE